jgi:phosphonate transport system substrate-binding protein
LEWVLAGDSTLASRLRVIETLGPSPSPPLIVAGEQGMALREQLRASLLALPTTAEGRSILAAGGLARFAAVADGDYDAIRAMAEVAQAAPDFV